MATKPTVKKSGARAPSRPAGASGVLTAEPVRIVSAPGKPLRPNLAFSLFWLEKHRDSSQPDVPCSKTGESRRSLREFAKTKLKATHFYDGTSGTRAILL